MFNYTAFHTLSYSAKLVTKEKGRPLRKIEITKSNGNVSVVGATWFARYSWLTKLLVALLAIDCIAGLFANE